MYVYIYVHLYLHYLKIGIFRVVKVIFKFIHYLNGVSIYT